MFDCEGSVTGEPVSNRKAKKRVPLGEIIREN